MRRPRGERVWIAFSWPEMTRQGIESAQASSTPVMALAAPGPPVVSIIPGCGLSREYAMAAMTPACSWWGQ